MNYAEQNEITRNYYKKDFTNVAELIRRIRNCLLTGEKISLKDLPLNSVVDFNPDLSYLFITLFQPFTKKIRYGSRKETLEKTIDRIVSVLRSNVSFRNFDIKDLEKTRILIEWETEKYKTNLSKLHTSGEFDQYRFEAGITGIEAVYNKKTTFWMPTDTPVNNEMNLTPVLAQIADKMGLTAGKNLKQIDKAKALVKFEDADFYLTKSHAFVSYKDEVIPLYRGNVLYNDFDYETLLDIFKTSTDYLLANMNEQGQFMYYYNSTDDNNIDHEHPTLKPPKLYYNDLRHCGGAITLLRMWELTKENKYLENAKRAIEWTISMTRFHKDSKGRDAGYVYANKKAKLGGVGLPLIMFMRYRFDSKDKSYDRYIEAYVRHLLSRITEKGEFLGYYIHPDYQDGQPLESVSVKDRREMFSFYYPGEALMGLAMFANRYESNPDLVKEVIAKSKIAMNWIINERPKEYSEMFKSLPADSWLMQAIEEWSHCKGFIEKCDINFVFSDAEEMMKRIYKRDDSPYIDFEGGMYYYYGDHYYPDGARCEGLIAAYYLAKNLEMNELANKILSACKAAAKCQFQLYISKYNNFAHQNPEKSKGGIKFKATRQWVRVDSVQHVACFFIRLYWSENRTNRTNIIFQQNPALT